MGSAGRFRKLSMPSPFLSPEQRRSYGEVFMEHKQNNRDSVKVLRRGPKVVASTGVLVEHRKITGGTFSMTIRCRTFAGAVAALLTLTGTAVADTIACEIISTTGDFENLEPNYRASADRAEFAILAYMRAVADDVLLYAEEQGGQMTSGYASIKAAAVRNPAGGVRVENIQILWPHTVRKIEGQFYSVIEMAQQQRLPIGLSLSAGGNPLGDIELAPGAFDPTSPAVGFNPDASATIHDKLMLNEGFSIRLMAGGAVYSTIEPDTARYSTFISDRLVPAMDEARRRDAEAPCTSDNPMDVLESIQF